MTKYNVYFWYHLVEILNSPCKRLPIKVKSVSRFFRSRWGTTLNSEPVKKNDFNGGESLRTRYIRKYEYNQHDQDYCDGCDGEDPNMMLKIVFDNIRDGTNRSLFRRPVFHGSISSLRWCNGDSDFSTCIVEAKSLSIECYLPEVGLNIALQFFIVAS